MLERVVMLTDEEIGALLAATAEARSIVRGFNRDTAEKYMATPWWAACDKLSNALGGWRPEDIPDELIERMALWLLSYNTRGVVSSFDGRPADRRTYRGEARKALASVLGPTT